MEIITSYWILSSIVVLIISVIVYSFMTRKFNYWKKRGIFEIKPLPFVGNLVSCMTLKQNPGFFMWDLYNNEKKKPYIGFYMLDKPALLIRDRETIKNMLIRDFNYFCDRVGTFNPKDSIGRSLLFFMKNPSWKIVRSKLTLIFTSSKMRKMFDLLVICTDKLDTYFNALGLDGNGKMIDVKDICDNITIDMIGTTAFGLNIDSMNNPTCEFHKKGKMIFDTNIFHSIRLMIGFFYPELSNFIGAKMFNDESITFFRNIFWNVINHRIKSNEKRGDLIDSLIEMKNEYTDPKSEHFKLNSDDLVAQAVVFFIGGFETTSTTISFMLYELAKHPEIQDRLREEIFDALDETNGQFTYDMVSSLSYLEMVVCEVLRLYPILGTLDRQLQKPYKIPNTDLALEKGIPVFISVYGLHYDPQFFPDPEKFDPERFNEENINKIPLCSYMPFGEGPRKCIGIRLGFLEIKLVIVRILCRFEITPCKKTPIPIAFNPKSPLTKPKENIYLNIQKLNEDKIRNSVKI